MGGFKCSGEGRSKIVLVCLSQAKMALRLQRIPDTCALLL
jgi:hypothetical protein